MEEEYCNIIFEVRREIPYLMSLEHYLDLWHFYTDNKLLTEKQALFCTYWDIYLNKTKAYQLAYDCSNRTANINGNRLFKKKEVHSFRTTDIDACTTSDAFYEVC